MQTSRAVHRRRRDLHRSWSCPAERGGIGDLGPAALRAAFPVGGLAADADRAGRVVEVNWRAVHRADAAFDPVRHRRPAQPGENRAVRCGRDHPAHRHCAAEHAADHCRRANLNVRLADGSFLIVHRLSPGKYIGQTALTREPVTAGANAVDELTVLHVPVAAVDSLVRSNPALAREIGRAIDARRQRIVVAMRAVPNSQRPASMVAIARRPVTPK
jgi:hypothetical protein